MFYFLFYFKWNCFLNVIFRLLLQLLKYKWFLYVDLVPYKLLNSFISSNSFFMDSLGSSVYKIMSSVNIDNFISSFPLWMPSISFYCLIILTRTSSIMLSRRSNSRYLSLVSHLRHSASTLSLSSMMLAVGFYNCPLSGWKSSFSFLVSCVFLSLKEWFCQMFFCIY